MGSAEEFYEHIFNTTAQGVFQSTPGGRYLRVNAAMARIYGYDSPVEMIRSVKDIARQIYVHPRDRSRFKQLIQKNDIVEGFESRNRRKDGSVIWTSTDARAVRGPSGKIKYYAGFVRDITDLKRVEQALGDAETRYRILLEQAPVAVYIDPLENNLDKSIYVSPQIERITGYSAEEWNRHGGWLGVVHPEDRERFIAVNQRTDQTGEPFDLEYRIICKDGHTIWLRDLARLIRDASGAPLYWHGTLIDITERMQLQRNMQKSEERFRKAFQASPVAACISSLKRGVILDVNNAYLTLSGFSRAQIIGKSAHELGFITKSARAKWIRKFKAAGMSLQNQETDFLTASGQRLKTIAYYETLEADGEPAILSMFHNITHQLESERALLESKERYRALVEHIPAIVFLNTLGKEQKTLYISPQVETILGYHPEEWMNDSRLWETSIHPDDRTRVLAKYAQASQNNTSWSEQYRMIARGGRVVWIQEEASIIHDDAGHPLYWQRFLLDITSKKEAENALGEVARAYQGLFDSVNDAIYVQDWSGRFIDVNLGAANMYGYPREYFLGKTPKIISAPGKNDMSALRQALERAFEGEPQHFEFWGRRSNGEIFPKDVHLYKGTYFDQDVVFAIARDITEQRRARDAQERQFKELTVLHALTLEGTRAASEDDLIERATDIIGQTLYPDTVGFLMVNEGGKTFNPHPSCRGVLKKSQMRPHLIGKGIAGQVILTGKPMIIKDVRTIKNYLRVNPTTRSELCVPMKIGERVIGAINVESKKEGFFTEDDERLLVTIAAQLATAIERLRTERAEREQRILAEALRDTASALNSTLDFQTVMDRILDNIDKVVPSETAVVMLIQNGVAHAIRQHGFEKYGLAEWIAQLELVCDKTPDFRRAIATRQPQLTFDTASSRTWVKLTETNWIRSALVAPILAENKAIGLISLNHNTPGFFSQRDKDRLMAFANQAASAIENARRFEEEARRAKIIEALADIANLIATTRDIHFALESIAEKSLYLLKARNIAIYLLQEDNKTLKIVTAKGFYEETLLSHSLKVGVGITGNVVATGKAEIISDLTKDPRRVRVPGTAAEDSLVEAMMSAPLILREKPIGAINAWRLRSNGQFSETELNFLISIAHQASIAIESGRLFEETLQHAQESTAIAEVGRDISSTLKLDIVLDRIAAYAKDLLRAQTSAVYLLENGNVLRATAAYGIDAEEIKSDPLPIGAGILGNIAMQKTGEIVNDTFNDPRAITIKGTEANRFEHIMGVPILLKDRLTGLMAVWRIGEGLDFKPRELRFLDNLAQQAAIAIENARLFHAEQQRREEAEILREATAVVATTLERERAIKLILDQLARVLKYDSASIQLLRDGYLQIVGEHGWDTEPPIIGMTFPIPGDNPNTQVILTRQPLIVNENLNTFEGFRSAPHSRIQSWLGIPLIAHGEVIGMLAVDSFEKKYFTDEHIRIVTAYANQAAIAIDNAQLHERSENQVRRLTALRDVDTAIASSLDLRVTLNILMDNAVSQLRADAMCILLYNAPLQFLETAASIGFHAGFTRHQFRINESPAGKVAITRLPLIITELNKHPDYQNVAWLMEENFTTYIGYPLLGKGQVKGVIEAYFRTPFTPDTDWSEFMQTMAGQAAIAVDNAQLFENLQRSNQELSLAYDTTLEGWGKALELRDKETEGHTRRVAELTVRLARRMNISDVEITHIRRGALLHDIGKMGVPDTILRKTGPLNEAEWVQMRMHPQYAYDLLYPIPYLRPALDIPYCHHEKWDGSGYPRGLKGEEIPLAARMFAIVDVWDALLSDRPYRKTWSRKLTANYIRSEAGTRFDPRIVEIFLEMISEME